MLRLPLRGQGFPQLCGLSDGKEGLGPLCWCFPGCLGDHSGLDKVKFGLMTAVPICPLPVSKWSAVPPEAMVCPGVVKVPVGRAAMLLS